jgi:hypothetical protein
MSGPAKRPVRVLTEMSPAADHAHRIVARKLAKRILASALFNDYPTALLYATGEIELALAAATRRTAPPHTIAGLRGRQ